MLRDNEDHGDDRDDWDRHPLERGPWHAILKGHNVVPVRDAMEWAAWFETADRRVCMTKLGRCAVSTVFLGLDHGHGRTPLWFETCVFRGRDGGNVGERYTAWDEAEAGHARAVREERASFDAWIDSPKGLKRVRVYDWQRGIAFIEGEDARPCLLVYRNRRRVPLRPDTYKRRFGVTP